MGTQELTSRQVERTWAFTHVRGPRQDKESGGERPRSARCPKVLVDQVWTTSEGLNLECVEGKAPGQYRLGYVSAPLSLA